MNWVRVTCKKAREVNLAFPATASFCSKLYFQANILHHKKPLFNGYLASKKRKNIWKRNQRECAQKMKNRSLMLVIVFLEKRNAFELCACSKSNCVEKALNRTNDRSSQYKACLDDLAGTICTKKVLFTSVEKSQNSFFTTLTQYLMLYYLQSQTLNSTFKC